MGTLFDDKAFEQFMEWIRENRKSAERVSSRIFTETGQHTA